MIDFATFFDGSCLYRCVSLEDANALAGQSGILCICVLLHVSRDVPLGFSHFVLQTVSLLVKANFPAVTCRSGSNAGPLLPPSVGR